MDLFFVFQRLQNPTRLIKRSVAQCQRRRCVGSRTRRALAQESRLSHLVRPSQYYVLSFDDAFALNRVVQQTTVKFFQALLHRISSLLEWHEILAAMSQQKSAMIIFQLRDVVFDQAAQTRQLETVRARISSRR